MRRPHHVLLGVLALGLAVSAAGCGGNEPGVRAEGAESIAVDASGDEIAAESAAAAADGSVALATAPTTVPPPASVVVVGDSLTESAKEELQATLEGAGIEVVAIEGLTNRRMVTYADGVPPGVKALEDVLAFVKEPPEAWVIALGTNDVGAAETPERFEADMREVLALLPADAPVVWVDVWIRDKQDRAAQANAVIRSVLAGRPGSTVVDWYRHGEEPGVIIDDGVHLTGDGQWIFARDVTDALLALGS